MFKKIRFSPHPFSKRIFFIGFEAGFITELFAAVFAVIYKTHGGQHNRIICNQLFNTGLRFFVISAMLFFATQVVLKPNR